ncbi:MAG: 2-C-methyl-D-erythritol 4-phosphate cytidylyltransferase, partial [Clostridia bacterium]|nr:2-C-methyl-D-erythritol 4-phosphate cytidylyltransferase [Clostridia bacterium]
DCQLAEAAGRRVKLVECAYTNIKITTREDICYAQAILEEGAQGDYL